MVIVEKWLLCAMWERVGMHCEKRLELSELGTFLPCENKTRVPSLAQLFNCLLIIANFIHCPQLAD